MRRILFTVIVCTAILVFEGASAHAAGKYVVAYFRELGYYENGGKHNAYIHVFDENGNPKSGVTLKSPSGTVWGTTNAQGFLDLVLYTGGSYEVMCSDGTGATSEIAPIMTTRRWPNWGHYSYECGFLYKSDAANPTTFDTSLIGTLNTETNYDNDAPCTRSLAYRYINPLDANSDQGFSPSSTGTKFQQTFRATGNRVIACKVMGVGYPVYTARILEGGPTGAQVGTSKSGGGDDYLKTLIAWPVNALPVTPGQTYCLEVKLTSGATWQAYRTRDNYTEGTMYIDGAISSGNDLFALVICGTSGDPVIISNIQVSDITNTSAKITWTTNYASTSRVDYGLTTNYGQNVYDSTLVTNHSINLTGLTPNTLYHFKVTSTAPGKENGVSGNNTFMTFATVPLKINEAKALADGTVVTLIGKTVTAGTNQFALTFYIEEQDRSGGIKVYYSGGSVSQGDGVDVTGTLSTSGGERLIINPTVSKRTALYPVPAPLGILSRGVGGASLNAYTPGVVGGVGTHNTGLLVQVWGKVSRVDTTNNYFCIDEGCNLLDGSGCKGLQVNCSGLASGNTITLPALRSYVKVTGISSRRVYGDQTYAVIRPRNQGDIVVLANP